MLMFVIVTFVTFLAVGIAEYHPEEIENQCVTPNQDVGLCIEIRKCLVFMDALALGGNESFAFIRESQCNLYHQTNEQPKVCCGKYNDFINGTVHSSLSCVTPNQDQGVCVNIRNCSVFIDAIVAGKNESYDFIRDSRCDSQNELDEQPKVCCGKHAEYLHQNQTCVTPNHDIGTCIDVRNCSVFMNAIASGKEERFDFIRESRCDSEDALGKIKVCCGRHVDYLKKSIDTKFARTCLTPNEDLGVCVKVKNCSVFVSAIESRNEESFEFIRESRCGSDGDEGQPTVCCGKYNHYLKKHNFKNSGNHTRLFPKFCGNHTLAFPTRIFGGADASLEEFPWMARLRYRNENGRFIYGCTGFLVSERFVLTAAHCVNSKSATKLGFLYDIQLGEYDTEKYIDCTNFTEGKVCAEAPQNIQIEKPIPHPKYTDDTSQHNDIAVIPLKELAKLTAYVYPICLSSKPSRQIEMWLSGWGKTETREENPIKLKVSVTRSDKLKCMELYRTAEATILDSQICAGGEGGRDSCTGDSGGPLMVQRNLEPWYAEGIVSTGNGCGIEGWPGIYTSIPHYMSWLRKVIKNHLREKNKPPGVPARSCTTPNGETAQCVSIYNCTVLYDAMKDPNIEVQRFVRLSVCNYDIEPYVCCGTVSNYQTSRSSANSLKSSESKLNDVIGNDGFICGLQLKDEFRILGGTPTFYAEFPWMALLQYRRHSGATAFPCGGALISKRYVLTAAHCVSEQTAQKVGTLVSVRLGEWDLAKYDNCENKYGLEDYCDDDPPVDASIEEIIIHLGYIDGSKNNYHDIALIRLNDEIIFKSTIAPICLPTIAERPSAGDRLWVAGWGRTENGTVSLVKLKVHLPVVGNDDCAKTYQTEGVTVAETQLCAGAERNKDSCQGDSGGPLMYETSSELKQWTIEGVVSFGPKCGTENWPGIYTRVTKYIDWIKNNIRP